MLLRYDGTAPRAAGLAFKAFTFAIGLVGSVGPAAWARGQNVGALARVVSVVSDPPGAMIWTKEGRGYACAQIVTPGKIELKFHDKNDAKSLLLSRFGYQSATLVVGAADEKIDATLTPWSTSFFHDSDDAPPEVQSLDAKLKAAFQEAFIGSSDPFPCAPFEFRRIAVGRDASQRLALCVVLRPRPPGWSRLKLAGGPDRQRRRAQAVLEGGVAEVLARFRPIVAGFPEIQDFAVTCLYFTSGASLDIDYLEGQYTAYRWTTRYDGVRVMTPYQVHTRTPVTVVTDKEVFGTVDIRIPLAKIPPSADKTSITEAVLAAADIEVREEQR